MAHLFSPTKLDAATAVKESSDAISAVQTTNGTANVGIWGGGPAAEALELQIRRGGFPASGVKKIRALNLPASHIQVYTVSGLLEGDVLVGVLSSGREWTGPVTVHKVKTGGTLMHDWAAAYRAGTPFVHPDCCSFAIPYLGLGSPGQMPELESKCIGGPINAPYGMAVHTTAGVDNRSAYNMAAWGCVHGWNDRGVSAHFGIAGDGTLVQFIPANLKAWAQSDPGNQHWVSVEVDNNGRSVMKVPQMTMIRWLYLWVCWTYKVPWQLSTGLLSSHTHGHDAITTKVCGLAGAATTTNADLAARGRGLSCHYWLKPVKPCPGPGILSQMASIITGA